MADQSNFSLNMQRVELVEDRLYEKAVNPQNYS